MALRSGRAAVLCGALFALLAASASGEEAWVREGTSLNLREGAGLNKPVLGSVSPGERLEVLGSLSGWTQVRREDGTQGWIANGFLVREAPASARIAALEAETARLRDALATAEREGAELRESAAAAPIHPLAAPAAAPPAPRAPAEEARNGSSARWLDYLVGALLLSTGMALGAMLRGVSGRRRATRLRL
jgi:hypothetical protein